jgi:serine protease Do
MNRKYLILFVVILTPLAIGFFLGFGIGQTESPLYVSGSDATSGGASFRQASYTNDERDSINSSLTGQRQNAITRVVGKASPAVVGINVTEVREYVYQNPWSQFFGNDPFFRQYFGNRKYQQEIKELGSGFIISPDGYILTNDHVAGNAKEITITMTNGKSFAAKLVGTDLVSDISLLKIEGEGFPFIPLGNSDDVIIGEWVIALGNPFGLFDISDKPTVTVGVVSATGMNLRSEEGRYYRGMIQTDASINQGNSGGPLVNTAGEVIGVNAVIFTPNQGSVGLGFAIPINRVKSVITDLRKNGKVDRDFWTGLEVQNIDDRVLRYFDLSGKEGVIITEIRRGSPASRAGFQIGDVIVEVNGERITNESDVLSLVRSAKVGDILKIKILREKKSLMLNLPLEKNP